VEGPDGVLRSARSLEVERKFKELGATSQDAEIFELRAVNEAAEDLVKIHPEAASTFEFGVSYDWALDPYAGGIGPLFRPMELTSQFYDDIVRPVGRVWFANDACDQRGRRWIEGAIAAATKNAYAINAGMRDEIPVGAAE
jgi:monoamine oxidase